MEVAHISVCRRDPETFWGFYGKRFAALRDKQPNGAHFALVELERRGLLHAVVTQNIDGLHAAAGTADLLEVHGSVATASCLVCGAASRSMRCATGWSRADGVPRCDCRPPLKPDVVLFGEMLPEAEIKRAFALAGGRRRAALRRLLAGGLARSPGCPQITLGAGGEVAIVTMGPTPYDRHAAVKLAGDVVGELEAVVAAV